MSSLKLKFNRKFKHIKRRGILKKLTLTFSVFIFIILLLVLSNLFILPEINLKGDKKVILSYNTKYKDEGYTAKYYGIDLTNKVKVNGNVNEKKLGTYKIKYSVKYGYVKKTVTRKIVVKDNVAPKLNINEDDIYVCPNEKVTPEKAVAIDEYDGDISGKITIKTKDDSITYSVEDSSGNKTTITKKIVYKDKTPPTITLNESNYIYLYIGDEYNELGYNTTDNCGESKVIINGKVDTNKADIYKINYIAFDKSNNKTEITRTVVVSEKTSNNTIYLTFDDGPNEGTTNVILDILKEEGVKATFFVTSKGPDELIKREFDEGHTVALHTSSHNYSDIYSSDEAYFNDLYSVRDRVKRITGYDANIIRFPGGSSNTISRKYSEGIMSRLTKETINRGFKYYDWNISSKDAERGEHTSDEIRDNVINNLSHDRVNMVLMHDIKPYTRDALREIIKYGKENGYRFEKITDSTEMITQRVNN